MRTADILKTANGNLLQSKLRTFLTVIAVFIGAFTLTLTSGMGAGISRYVTDQVSSFGAKNVLYIQAKGNDAVFGGGSGPKEFDPNKTTVSSSIGNGGSVAFSALTPADIEKLKGVEGLSDVAPVRGVSPAYVSGPNGKKYELAVASYPAGTTLAMDAGVQPESGAEESQVALPLEYVAALGFSGTSAAVGSTVTFGVADPSGRIGEIDATVTGVPLKSLVSDSGGAINAALEDAMLSVAQKGLPAASTDRYVNVTAQYDPSYTDVQVADLKARLDGLGFTAFTVADRLGVIQKAISAITMVFNLFGVIALLAASFGVINTLLMAVQERTREIGLMKAMGMGSGKIFLLFSAEAILLGFWGSVLGVLAAYGVGQAINRVAANGFAKDLVGLRLLAFPPQSVAAIVLAIMLVAFLAGTLPARRASKLNPIDALRYE